MATKDFDTARWKASITVSLTPVNRYGDVLGDSLSEGYNELSYHVKLEGSLVDVVTRLESLKES